MKKLAIATSTLTMSLLLLTGCSLFSPDEPKDSSPSSSVDEDDLPEMKNPPAPENLDLPLPDKSLKDHSDDDIAETRKLAQDYITHSLTSPELLSGKWWEDGHDMEKLAELGEFSDDLSNDIENLDPSTGLGAQTTQSVALFLAPSDDIQATPKCVRSGENCSSAPFYGKATWKSVNKKVIKINVTASVTRDVLEGKRSQQVLDTYTYNIGLSKSKKNGWVISQIKNSYTIGKFTGE